MSRDLHHIGEFIEGVQRDEKWTAADEREFRQAEDRRERVIRSRIKRLATLVTEMPTSDQTRAAVADWLQKNAGRVRDALQDFDDGARCTNSTGEKLTASPFVIDELLRSAGLKLGQEE